jgi:hypothetical protein
MRVASVDDTIELCPAGAFTNIFSDSHRAEDFLDGSFRFSTLAYFRDYEHDDARGDINEGSAVYRPDDGLVINNLTQGKTFTLRDHSFQSGAPQAEIFIFCLSRSLSRDLFTEFGASVCIEILDISAFCARVGAALPRNASFPKASDGRPRIGHRVEY